MVDLTPLSPEVEVHRTPKAALFLGSGGRGQRDARVKLYFFGHERAGMEERE